MTGLLHFEVSHVLFRGHVETGFKFSLEGAERYVGGGGKFGDRDVFVERPVQEFQRGPQFVVLLQGGITLAKWPSYAYDAADIAPGVEEGFFIGGGPIDKAVAGRNEFDSIVDGFTGFNDMEVVLAPYLHNMKRDEVPISFSQDLGAVIDAEQFEQTFIEEDVAQLDVFDEKRVASQVIEDTGDRILKVVLLKKSVVFHQSI